MGLRRLWGLLQASELHGWLSLMSDLIAEADSNDSFVVVK
jgi:hypothetical protein